MSMPHWARTFKQRVRSWLIAWARLTTQTHTGVPLRVATFSDWVIYNDVFVEGEYDPAIVSALRPDRPARVLDLGANVGFFSLRTLDLARRSGTEVHITAVEGNPSTAIELRRRLSCAGSAARIAAGLVGDRAGEGCITNRAETGLNSIIAERADRPTRVPFVNLDELVPGEIDLLKCDIEGSELAFIRNYPALLRRTRVAVFELHHELCDYVACKTLLLESGFNHERILKETAGASLCLYWRD